MKDEDKKLIKDLEAAGAKVTFVEFDLSADKMPPLPALPEDMTGMDAASASMFLELLPTIITEYTMRGQTEDAANAAAVFKRIRDYVTAQSENCECEACVARRKEVAEGKTPSTHQSGATLH